MICPDECPCADPRRRKGKVTSRIEACHRMRALPLALHPASSIPAHRCASISISRWNGSSALESSRPHRGDEMLYDVEHSAMSARTSRRKIAGHVPHTSSRSPVRSGRRCSTRTTAARLLQLRNPVHDARPEARVAPPLGYSPAALSTCGYGQPAQRDARDAR
jgi:hypothetical protein